MKGKFAGLLSAILLPALCLPSMASAAVYTWDFSAPSEYAYDDPEIEIVAGKARLGATTTPSWLDNDWGYRTRVRIDHTKVVGDVTDFPVLISTVRNDWRSIANGGSVSQADGDDFVFTAADGTTRLPYEIERYDATTGELVAWVRAEAVSASTDTDLYLYYGNGSVSAQEQPEEVWEQYRAVQHLDEGSSNGVPGELDSTVNGYDGTPRNFGSTASSTTLGTGRIARGVTFDGTNDYVSVTNEIPATEAGATQQGIATDGTYIYIASTGSPNRIYKYTLSGTFIASSSAITKHLGGMTYANGKIYVASSVCPGTGTTSEHEILEYSTDLAFIGSHDIGADFTVCAGSIAYHDGHFYVGESYFDDVHDDHIVKYDESFTKVETITYGYQSSNGIQGLEYIPFEGKFRVNSHGNDYYTIDPDFDPSSIETFETAFDLQDLAYVSGSLVLYNDRPQMSVARGPTGLGLSDAYTVEAWFRMTGNTGARRTIVESMPDWALSIEVDASNRLAYSVKTTGTNVIKQTAVTPTQNAWHHVALTYAEGSASKIYYDGAELTAAAGVPTGALVTNTGMNIGTFRTANARYFNGAIDEVRLSDTVRSSAHIATGFTNQNDPSTFYSLSPQQVPYSTLDPAIAPTSPLAALSFEGFSESAEKDGGAIGYQLSNDGGASWYWYDGAAWLLATSSYAFANPAATIHEHISSFPVNDTDLLFKAFLHSNGSQRVALDAIELQYVPRPEEEPSRGRSGQSSVRVVSANADSVVNADSTPSVSSIILANRALFLAAQAQGIVLPAFILEALDLSSASSFTRDLTLGSGGEDVRMLQTILIAKGHAIPAGATGYFGEQTRAALAAYQAANGIAPAAGYFGEKTRALIN